MAQALDRLTIIGFKSILAIEGFELTNLNVLIGGNGAGKSNFVDFFRMLRAMMELPLPGLASASLKAYIADGGGSDDFLFNGPKITKQNGKCWFIGRITQSCVVKLFRKMNWATPISPTAKKRSGH